MDDSELSRLLGLLSNRTALTGEYPSAHAPKPNTRSIPADEGTSPDPHKAPRQHIGRPAIPTSQNTTPVARRNDAGPWYTDCPETNEVLLLGRFSSEIASERGWEHARRVDFVKSKADPPVPVVDGDPKRPSAPSPISSSITFQLDDISPREWPHIPGKDVTAWDRDVVAGTPFRPQLDCATKLLELAPGTLRYEPVNLERFARDVQGYLHELGIPSLSDSNVFNTSPPFVWTTASFRATLVLLALGVQLQSAAILHEVASLWLHTPPVVPSAEDRVVLEMALKSLAHFPDATRVRLAMPVSRCIIGSWILEAYHPSVRDAIACDGRFLYIYGRMGLLKIGTGAGETLRNVVYQHRPTYCRGADVERSWLCLVGDALYCRTITMPGHSVDRISLDFETITPLLLGTSATTHGVSSTSVYAMITDGTSLFTITCRDQLSAFMKTPAPPMLQRSKTKRKEKAAAAASEASVVSVLEANPIAVGNRVVRGPDWKWSNQDGEPGSVGTVERISTWGGVQGSGITVRWDKNQRMNTYRWGAEGCFDIQIVEEDTTGNIVAQKPLKKDGGKASTGAPARSSMHQFVVYRYDPSSLACYLDMPDEGMHGLLNIVSKADEAKSSSPPAMPLRTTLHEHLVGESPLTTGWICDGQQPSCLGPSVPRFRCLEGCDFDMCAVCLDATLIKEDEPKVTEDLVELPFAQEEDAFFHAEPKSEGIVDGLAQLEAAWQGQFGHRECTVALLKHDNNVEKANEWLATSGAILKTRCIIPICGSVLLEQNNLSFLDPVLLIAGSFYTTGMQLGIVIPVGICHIEPTPRRRRHGDVLCVFSIQSGALLTDFSASVAVPDVPAGSPMCYDFVRDRIIGFSTNAQVLMEFTNMEHATPVPNTCTHVEDDPGKAVLYHLTRIMGLRHQLSPIHYPVKTLEYQLQALERTKTKKRQLKKMEARLDGMRAAFPDPTQGYFLPFCVDVTSLASLGRSLHVAVQRQWPPAQVDHLLYLVAGLLEEAMSAGIASFGDLDADALESLLVALGQGEGLAGGDVIGSTSRLAQRALLWGMIHQVFFRSSAKLQSALATWCTASLDVSATTIDFMLLMPLSHPVRAYSTAVEAKIGFVGSLLRTLASSTIFLDRLGEDPTVWLDALLELTDKEATVLRLQYATSLAPTHRLLFSITAYMLHRPTHPHAPYVIKRGLERCRTYLDESTDKLAADESLRTSVVGTILPLLTSGLEHHPALARTVLPLLEDLLLVMDANICALPRVQAAEDMYARTEVTSFFSQGDILESPHPYGLGVPTYRKQIHAPGATAIAFEFDAASRTLNSNDFVFVTSNPYANLDRLSADHSLPDEEYLYGPAPWPNYSLAGDSAMMVLCASTHPMDHMGQDKQRYGFKCKVKGYYAMSLPFLLHMQHAVAHLVSCVSRDLIAVESSESEVAPATLAFLSAWHPVDAAVVAVAQDANHPIVAQVEAMSRRFFLRKGDEWRRTVVAALAVYLGTSRVDVTAATPTELMPIIQQLLVLQREMLRHTQIENEWYYLVTEETTRELVMDRLADNEELVTDLCAHLGIKEPTTDALYNMLVETKASPTEWKRSTMVQDVGERAWLLLRHKNPRVDGTTASLALSAVTHFLQSSVQPPQIDTLVAHHEANARRRIVGLQVVSRMLQLKSKSTRQFFLGLLASSMQHATKQSSMLSDCELGCHEVVTLLRDTTQQLMESMLACARNPTMLYSHKVLMMTDLSAIDWALAPSDSSLFLLVVDLIQSPPTWSLPPLECFGFDKASPLRHACPRRVGQYVDVLWMAFRRFLWKDDVPLPTRLDACHALFVQAKTPADKSRILNLLHRMLTHHQSLSPLWIATIKDLAVDFSQPPQVTRAAIRLLHVLTISLDIDFVRRMVYGIGQALALTPLGVARTSVATEFATVLFWNSTGNDVLMKLVNLLDDQLQPEIASWDVAMDANSLEKQQLLMLDTSIVHRYVQCDGCGMNPLVGYRFKCHSCSNYDLCTACYVGKVHDVDHIFLRCSDATGSGDQLPPRSSESLVGSRLWKTSLLQSELQSKGFVVLLKASEESCRGMANSVASLDMACTVLGIDQVRRMQALYLEKEGAAARNAAAAMLHATAPVTADYFIVKQELASEYIALVRQWLASSSATFDAVAACFKLVPGLFVESTIMPSSEVYEGLGAVAVLGGMTEPLRPNGFVMWNNMRARVQQVLPGQVHLKLESGRVETDVKSALVTPVSASDITQPLANLLLNVLDVFDATLDGIHAWLTRDDVCMIKAELSWRVLKALNVLVPWWPSVSDNQVLAMYGNVPKRLLQLAQKCPAGTTYGAQEMDRTQRMVWAHAREMHHFLAFKPTLSPTPIPSVLDETINLTETDDHQESTYWYNLYAYASMSDLPQHPGRNKLLDHWERHVIPAIQKYVRGSFKSYEMDYFFAQLREPLREGNNTAARRIAHTLCDGHVPPGCIFPEADTDWSALQWDDLEIGDSYRIDLDLSTAPASMQWCHGHMGTIALIDPSLKLALLQVVNPNLSTLEHWWLPVAQLQAGNGAQPSISKFNNDLLATLQRGLSHATFQLARECVFAIVRECPEYMCIDPIPSQTQPGYPLSTLLQVVADRWSPVDSRKQHPIKDAIYFHQSNVVHPAAMLQKQPKKKAKDTSMMPPPKDILAKAISTQTLLAVTQAMQAHTTFVVTSASPPEPLVRLHVPDVSWMVLTFFVHPVLMDLPAGSSMEIYLDAECTQLVRGYYGGRKGLMKLPPVWIAANTCFVKMAAAQYARYKFRVDGIHASLGIATWLNDLMGDANHWGGFLEQGSWPPLIQQVAFEALIPKMPRTISPGLAAKLKEQWQLVYAEENPVFSTYAQQLVEMMVSIPDDSVPVITSFRRMTKFADALTDPSKEGVVGRVPLDEIKCMVEKTQACDYFTQRLIIVQKLPKTLDQAGLEKGISKWIVHLSLECCGEADDQSIFSATDATRFGIVAKVLYCPVDEQGYTRGFCIVDVGRDDIVEKLMACLTRTPFYFEGEHTDDDPALMAFINQRDQGPAATASAEPVVWQCPACTLENAVDATLCGVCESPRPDLPTDATPPTSTAAPAEDGWTCSACTFLNSWDNPSCSVCDMACDKERPVAQETVTAPADTTDAPLSDANQHTLSVLKFNDAYNAGHDRDPRIDAFLQAVLVPPPGMDVSLAPRDLYMEMRARGYDFQAALSHFPLMQSAISAMGKWTVAMDVQLIEMARHRCHRIGMLNLTDMSVSHLAPPDPQLHPLLAPLPLQEIRLRFLLVQQWNLLLCDTLSLVDFHHVGAKLVALRKLIFPGVKIRFFNLVQDNTTQSGEKKPTVVLDRLKWKRDPSISLFDMTRQQLQAVNPITLRAKRPLGASDPFIAFGVVFSGENVVGEGGPYRQLFSDMAHECLRLRIFQPTPNAALKIGDNRDMLLPRPSATSRSELEQYEFVGLLMGCCLRTGVHLPLRLAPSIWKSLVQQPVGLVDLKQVDQSLHDSLLCIQSDSSLLEGLTFTTTLSDGTPVELVKGGTEKPVTKGNVAEYVRLVHQVRLHECKPQVDALLRGIGKIVPLSLLPLCSWSELQQWICGSQAIDIDLLKRHTKYSAGMTVEKFPHLEYFWQALHSFSEEDKRRFINFAWGQESLPADDAEFDRTRTRLLIKPPPTTDKNQDSLLPKADTCFFNIELPAYSSVDLMAQKLHLAINLCTSMDADEQTGRMDVYFEDE
ncbi:Aste57867_24944 [Aphanomyces stellatus]|uniref:Aste57867_24944 protein n=1 Tax=Aphanomyces stellatus TaxID=120398 RepID=A0A485LRS9_9STRA|nr:hypothetical protein As57867_024866 [Aphanomyces stellatus]VFU01575.1 Aste57867_24944 [Aphanomyces stellatus]